MFGIWKRKQPIVLDHWWVAADGLQSSVEEFYAEVEEELDRRQAPGVESSRVFLPEGPLGGGSRQYLRLRRERLIFDVCSAPFGTSWFFSCRIAQIPFVLRLWELAVLIAALVGVYSIFPAKFGPVWGAVAFAGTVLGFLSVLNAFAGGGARSVDGFLLKIPVLGALYEIFLRRNDTYYQEDARIMYASLVGHVIKDKVREFAAAGGIEDVEFQSNSTPLSPRGLRRQVWDTTMESTAELRAGAATMAKKAFDKLL